MRVLVISDIHGNLEALTALTETYDELWVLGDLVDYGPDPGAVVDFVRSHASMVVRGNHDDAVGFNRDPRCSTPYKAMAEATMQYSRSVLSPEQINYLANLPTMARRAIDGTKFVLCHAAPSDPLYKYIPANSLEWGREIKLIDADVLLVGHTHTPFLQRVGNAMVVNPGSLGQPKTGSIRGCYATWEGTFSLREADYDIARTLDKIGRMPVPLSVRKDLKAVLRSGGLATSERSLGE